MKLVCDQFEDFIQGNLPIGGGHFLAVVRQLAVLSIQAALTPRLRHRGQRVVITGVEQTKNRIIRCTGNKGGHWETLSQKFIFS